MIDYALRDFRIEGIPPIGAAAKDGRLIAVWFQKRKHEDVDAAVSRRFPDETVRERQSAVIRETFKQLREYFAGTRRVFDLPIDAGGTDFQAGVWRELQRIPYGRTVSYGDIAKSLKRPGAAIAVGQANGRNPVAIIVPCHRVIGANGALVGYASGTDIKQRLLLMEGAVLL